MKKLVIAVLAVGFVAVAAQAQEPAKVQPNRTEVMAPLTKFLETIALKAAEENSKIDFSGLHGSMKDSVKKVLKDTHPKFTHMVYLGEIGKERKEDWSQASSTQDEWYYYYFVVTENGTDYFYTATRQWHHYSGFLSSKTTDGLVGSVFAMGVAPTDPTLSKKTLEDLKATLPEPFKTQLKELLKGVALSNIESIKVTKGREYTKNDKKRTEYELHYTLKDGSVLDREFTYLHPQRFVYNYGGSSSGGMIE